MESHTQTQAGLAVAARIAAVVVGVIALFVALRLAQGVFAPMLLALVVGVVLSPLSGAIDRLGLPQVAGALIGLLVILTVLGGLVLLLEPVVRLALQRVPRLLFELRDTVAALQRAMADLNTMTDEIARAINPNGGDEEASEQVSVPRMTDALYYAPAIAAQVMIFVGTLFFFLLSRNDIYQWVADRFPERRRVVTAWFLKRAERRVSRYFLTITMINAAFGLTVTLALTLLGMPVPMMWGLIAFLLNFLLYLGPATVSIALLLAGTLVFDGPMVFAPAAAFVLLNLMEGQFVTPALVGRQMRVNPLLVFLSLVFWLWLWGPLGGFVAIPLLVWLLALSGAPVGRRSAPT